MQQKFTSIPCLLYAFTAQIISGIYILLLSTLPLALKLVIYLIPTIGLATYIIIAIHSIKKNQQTLQSNQQALQYIASHDLLTGLYNRREFEIILDKMISQSQRFNDQFALFVIDIDHFKQVNDTLGHALGDELIVLFTKQLNSFVRKEDTLARIGGDEFTLITSRLPSPTSAKQLAHRLINRLDISYCLDGKSLKITVSIGIAIYPLDGKTRQALLKKADLAMYQAKKSGKNTVALCH